MSINKTNKKKIDKIITNLKNTYSSEELINASIITFIRTNSKIYNLDIISSLSECNKYKQELNNELDLLFKSEFENLSIKEVEAIFESLIDIDRKKAEGAVYTPDYIIDYIINHSLKIYKGKEIPVFCDPSCGSGGFLVRAVVILSEKFNIPIEKAILYIKGIDINKQSVSCAKIILELFFLEKGIIINSLDHSIIVGDTLLSSKDDLLKRLDVIDGIDILATNPPYVKLQNINQEVRKSLIEIYPEFTKGSYSFSMLFLVAGKKLLSKNGVLGYITQNNFFTSLSAKNVREYLKHEKCIHTIIDFLHTKVFENASAYTCLIFLTSSNIYNEFSFKWALSPKIDLDEKDFSKINVNNLDNKKWRLAPNPHLQNIEKIEKIGCRLGDIADIRVGFATLKDAVFLLENDSSVEIEEDILIPAIKIAELNNEYSIIEKQRKIIFPYKKKDNKFVAYEESELKEKFPLAYDYLLSKKDLLLTRSEGKKKLDNFYEWGRTQGMEPVSDKLLTKTFAGKPNFMLDKTMSVICNGYSIKPKKLNNSLLYYSEIDILILQKILNSDVMNYYSKLTSFQLDGNFQCFQKNFIELFGIPNLNEENIKHISTKIGEELNNYLYDLYDINYQDIHEIIHR